MKSKYTKTQRILAVIGIVLLVALYIIALISSFFHSPAATGILYSALFCTFFIPVVIYLFGLFIRKKDDGSSEIPSKKEDV